MKKKLILMSSLILLSLFISGCGNKTIAPTTTTTKKTTNETKETWDFDYTTNDNKLVLNFNDFYYMVFNFAGDKIADMWYVYDFKDVKTADTYVAIYRAQYKDDTNGIKSVYRKGASVIIELEGSEYKNLTRKQIEATFSYLKTMYGK